jgi:prepilin-type N-terminal cleavage/methylation domain-containing protein
MSARSLRQRGFTLIEIMLVLGIIGCLATLAIPLFQRFVAKSRKAEVYNVLGKMEQAFRSNYQATGNYGNFLATPGASPDVAAEWNPPLLPGGGAPWVDSPNYKTFQFRPEGSLHLRYKYTVSNGGKTVVLEAQGTFPGIPNWSYMQTFSNGAAPFPATEVPSL